jgi:outer membrane biosynthesis protein TonB
VTAIAGMPPFERQRFDWGHVAGLAIAVLGHIFAFVLLSASFLAKPDMVKINEHPIEVTLSDDIGLVATAPQSVTPPAQSVAPDIGKPDDAAPPAPATPAPNPTPPAPRPMPAPTRAPRDTVRPDPLKPAPQTPQKPSRTQAAEAALPNPANFSKPSTGHANATKARPHGATLGDDFLKGLDDKPSKSHSQTPRAAVIDAKALASLSNAISRMIQPCADRQVSPGPGASRIVTTFNLRLNPDGTLAATPTVVRQDGIDEENDRYARRVTDLGIAAFKGCSPLKLPPEYYSTPNGGWNNINYKWQLTV